MRRREFLQAAGAAGFAAAVGTSNQAAAADKPVANQPAAEKAVTVRQTASDRFVLDFKPATPRPLRVLQFTDTHFGTADILAKVQDKRTFTEMQRLVKLHQPDFIVHTGDFINNDQGPKTSFEAIEVFDSLGVPWTHALGNHDIGARSVPEFRQPMKHASVGEFKVGDATEYAFRFDVVTSGSSDPAYSLFCFDSGAQDPNRRVSRPQLDWFEGQMKHDAKEGIKTPALAMIHIPIVEFNKLQSAQLHKGHFGESVCFDNDTGDTFSAFKKSARVKGVFSGHDHKNDYAGVWEGIELVYGRVSGWHAYGDLRRGGRMIEIDLPTQSFSHRLVYPEA